MCGVCLAHSSERRTVIARRAYVDDVRRRVKRNATRGAHTHTHTSPRATLSAYVRVSVSLSVFVSAARRKESRELSPSLTRSLAHSRTDEEEGLLRPAFVASRHEHVASQLERGACCCAVLERHGATHHDDVVVVAVVIVSGSGASLGAPRRHRHHCLCRRRRRSPHRTSALPSRNFFPVSCHGFALLLARVLLSSIAIAAPFTRRRPLTSLRTLAR